MSEKELHEYAYLWDGSEGWSLSSCSRDEAVLTVVFAGTRPSVAELAALRRLSDEFRELPVRELKSRLGDKSEIELGRFSGMVAHEIEERSARIGVPFSIRSQYRHSVSYSPIQRSENGDFVMLLIENEDLRERVTSEMLKRGVPVTEYIEID